MKYYLQFVDLMQCQSKLVWQSNISRIGLRYKYKKPDITVLWEHEL